MKKIILLQLLLITTFAFAQVGINTTSPEALLDIKSSNQALPTNKDGLLIPNIDSFPAINPTAALQGMLVYLTTTVGVNVPGFYYWNNSPASWLFIKGANGGTLDQAYDFGGAGLGIGASTYTPSTNGATQFTTANTNDRLFVIGNAIDVNKNELVDGAERSDVIIILKSGLTRLPSTTNAMITAADLKAVVTKEYFEQSGWSLTGNAGTTTSNFIGTTDLQPFSIRTNNTTRATILATGEFGIGTVTPDRKLEVEGSGIQYARITSTGSSEVGIEFKRIGSGFDWQIRNDAGELIFGQSTDELVTVSDVVRMGGGSLIPATDNAIQLGQSTRKWSLVYATNGVIQTSDVNDKKEMLPLNYGLEKIKSLRPISFQWKNDNIDKSSTHLGFLAQEVQQVLPEIVVDHEWKEIPDSEEKVWEKTDKLGMKYPKLFRY